MRTLTLRDGRTLTVGNKFKDLTGLQFGPWKVISLNKIDRNAKWNVQCSECGGERIRKGTLLITGRGASCNCRNRSAHYGKPRPLRAVEYVALQSLKMRCYNPKNKGFKNYGGRGISVCQRWLDSYDNFLNDMGKRPGAGYSIERKDTNGNYEPSNCVWATAKRQANNRTNNRMMTLHGTALNVTEWAERMHLRPGTIFERLARGWTDERALTTPVKSPT